MDMTVKVDMTAKGQKTQVKASSWRKMCISCDRLSIIEQELLEEDQVKAN